MKQEDPAQEYRIINEGRIRKILSENGYYISSWGLISDEEGNYPIGRLIYLPHGRNQREKVVISTKKDYEDYAGTDELILFLRKNKVYFEKVKIRTSAHLQLKIIKAERKLERIIEKEEKKQRKSNAQTPQLAVQD